MMENNTFSLVDENGNEIMYEVLLNIRSEQFNKSYIVVTPVDVSDEETQVSVTPYSYTLKEDGTIDQLFEIETREEFELIKREFFKMMNEGHDHEHGCGCHHGDDDHECCGGHHHHGDHECCGGHHHDDDEDHVCSCHHE
jgi:uncharacterized protein YrzB (UPF0473 family)